MKEFISRNVAFISIVVATILLLLGGVFLFTRGAGGGNTANVNAEVLIPQDSYKYAEEAQVTLVEFGDFQCPACSVYHSVIKQVLRDYDGKLNLVFRNFPLAQHKNALISSYAAEAAGLQGKYWQMYDKIYETQSGWSESGDAKSIFLGYAEELGLDRAKFEEDIASDAVKAKVQRDVTDGTSIGIKATPTFFLNGEEISPPASYEGFKSLIDKALGSD